MASINPIFVLNKTLLLHQIEHGFRTSTDSVLLGASCPLKSGESILDLGCGVGSAGLCAISRMEDTSLLGLDIQDDHIQVAIVNADENNMAERADFKCHDIRLASDIATFDHVICNPPYKESGAHIPSPSDKKALAMGHQDESISLQDWITFAWNHISRQGSLTMIHEAEKTDEIIHSLYSPKGGKRFGNIEIFPVFSKAGQKANRVIVRSWKHRKAGTTIHPGIIMHDEDGRYSAEADIILRDAKRLF